MCQRTFSGATGRWPGPPATEPAELFCSRPGFDERFLRKIFEPVRVAFIAVKNRKHERLVTADQFRELVRRPAANSLQQFGIVVHL